jgi:predicted SAM-dependent methyltransferase
VKLHLGCGPRCIPGFVHVDLGHYPHVDHVQDVRNLAIFADGSAELIYASHVLEYFDWQEALEVLKEWRRVLQTGGLLRLAVPDWSALLWVYRRTHCLAGIEGPLYGRMEVEGQVLYHRSVYDYATLSTLLRLSGYRRIRRWVWRDTEHAGVDDCSQSYYPHMAKDDGVLLSLNLEAEK